MRNAVQGNPKFLKFSRGSMPPPTSLYLHPPQHTHTHTHTKNPGYAPNNRSYCTPKNRPRGKRERQSSTPESATRAQTANGSLCQNTLDELNSKINKLLPIFSQISQLQENVEQLLKENAKLKKAIEFLNS